MDKNSIVHALAAMTETEFREAVTQARGDNTPQAQKQAAVDALRRKVRGHNTADTDPNTVTDSQTRLNEILGGHHDAP